MIPTHNLEQQQKRSNIRIVELTELTKYDTTKQHRHNYFELFIFDIGSGSHDIDFTSFPIHSGEIHIVSDGRVHKVKRDLNTRGFVILFEASVFETNSSMTNFLFDHSCYDVTELSPIYRFDGEKRNQILAISKNIWTDYNSNNELKDEFIRANLSLLLLACMRSIDGKQSSQDKTQSIYLNFRKLLHSNFKVEKKVNFYASSLNISEKQLHSIVKIKTGLSTRDLINKQVVLEAKRLLNLGLSSKEVAYDLNFNDPAHFSKYFKLKTGISPKDFA